MVFFEAWYIGSKMTREQRVMYPPLHECEDGKLILDQEKMPDDNQATTIRISGEISRG